MPRKPKQAPRKRPARKDAKPLRFPAPGQVPPRFYLPPRDEQERARMQDELHDWTMRDLIHRAVHTNDPEMRRWLASRLSHDLLHGWPLTQTSREWLSWVLMRLSDSDQVPHLARGNAIKSEARVTLIKRLFRLLQGLPPGPVTERLEQARKALNISFGKRARSTTATVSRHGRRSSAIPSNCPTNKWNEFSGSNRQHGYVATHRTEPK